jgi:hypothetical protein
MGQNGLRGCALILGAAIGFGVVGCGQETVHSGGEALDQRLGSVEAGAADAGRQLDESARQAVESAGQGAAEASDAVASAGDSAANEISRESAEANRAAAQAGDEIEGSIDSAANRVDQRKSAADVEVERWRD